MKQFPGFLHRTDSYFNRVLPSNRQSEVHGNANPNQLLIEEHERTLNMLSEGYIKAFGIVPTNSRSCPLLASQLEEAIQRERTEIARLQPKPQGFVHYTR